MTAKSSFSNANFPMTEDGRTYHVNARRGDVANRIVTVGDPARAIDMAKLLDSPPTTITSKRGFTTLTGKFKGVDVSIVSIGMGVPMMDFFVREVRAVVDGPMAIIRFGSCGSISEAKIGQICVADSAVLVQRNVNAFADCYVNHAAKLDGQTTPPVAPYTVSQRCPADPSATSAVSIYPFSCHTHTFILLLIAFE